MSNPKNFITQPLNYPILKNITCPRCNGDSIRLIGDESVCDDCDHTGPAPVDLLKRQRGDRMLPGFEGV